MNSRKLKDGLTKSAWKLSASIKDTVAKNVVRAVNSKEIDFDKKQVALQKLVYLIQASVDSAFESSVKELQREIDSYLEVNAPDGAKKK